MESANKTARPDLSAALDRLWARFLPEIRERVAAIDSAVASLVSGPLGAGQKDAAASAAHKLAGVLGTFNLSRGTDIARELELAFSATPGNPAHLAALTAELRTMIESRG
jgi:HPt (histidine-containing phosphotransfer) domain-containing protein